MATTTSNKTNRAVPDFEAAAERARDTNERLLETGRKVSSTYLDGVENYVSGLLQLERKVAGQSKVEPVASMLSTHAQLTEDVFKASVSAARELITA